MAIGVFPGIIELVMMLGLGGGMGVPLGVPPAPEDPLMANAAPEECLFYTTWSGMAEPDPASTNQGEQLLAEPEVRHLITELEKHIVAAITAAAENEGPEATTAVKDGVKWGKTLLTHATMLFISKVEMGPEGMDVQGGAVVEVGEEGPLLKATLERYQTMFLGPAAKPVQIDGETWYELTLDPSAPVVTWGVKKRYFVIGIGEGAVEGILARARTAPPQWLADLRKNLAVERISTVTYVNIKAIVETFAPMGGAEVVQGLEAFGLGNVTSLSSVTGLDKEAFVSRTLLGVDGELQGLLQAVPQEPLSLADLAPIPADATIAFAARIDANDVFEAILSMVSAIEPRARAEMLREMGQGEAALGVSFRDDLFKALGDTWCIYNSPGEGGLVFTGLTGVNKVRDAKRLAKFQDAVIKLFEQDMARMRDRNTGRTGGYYRPVPSIDKFEFAGQDVYVFNPRESEFPVTPSWCITDKELIVAAYPQNIKAYLSRAAGGKSLATVPQVAGLFSASGGPVALTYCDTPKLFELLYPMAPILAQMGLNELAREGVDIPVSLLPSASAIGKHLRPGVSSLQRTEAGLEFTSRQSLPGGSIGATVPVGAALLLPAVQSARMSARRARSMNNLKQIGLGMLNHESAKNKFPAAYSVDKKGKALLSWRVHILPYVEYGDLYDQFQLDEPWDSDHNKKLIEKMPSIYRSSFSQAAPNAGKTNYLTIRGKDTIFPGKDATSMGDIKDGASNTLMTVEVSDEKAVIWTKPDDFEFDEKNPMKGLIGSQRHGDFLATYADGSVRVVHPMPAAQLKALFTRAGGEKANPNGSWEDDADAAEAHDHTHEEVEIIAN